MQPIECELSASEYKPCTIDGKPAMIVGYGDGNAGAAIDYRLVLEDGGLGPVKYGPLQWIYAGSSRMEIK